MCSWNKRYINPYFLYRRQHSQGSKNCSLIVKNPTFHAPRFYLSLSFIFRKPFFSLKCWFKLRGGRSELKIEWHWTNIYAWKKRQRFLLQQQEKNTVVFEPERERERETLPSLRTEFWRTKPGCVRRPFHAQAVDDGKEQMNRPGGDQLAQPGLHERQERAADAGGKKPDCKRGKVGKESVQRRSSGARVIQSVCQWAVPSDSSPSESDHLSIHPSFHLFCMNVQCTPHPLKVWLYLQDSLNTHFISSKDIWVWCQLVKNKHGVTFFTQTLGTWSSKKHRLQLQSNHQKALRKLFMKRDLVEK